MIGRLLQQLYPPSGMTGVPLSGTDSGLDSVLAEPQAGGLDYQLVVSQPGVWEGRCWLDNGFKAPFLIRLAGQQVHVWIGGESYVFSVASASPRNAASRGSTSDEVVCSMPGVVLAVHVSEGDIVEAGQEIVVLESMKTEQVIKAPRAGTIHRVSVQPGDRVDRGMRLVALVPLSEE